MSQDPEQKAPRIRRRTFADKLLHFSRRALLGAVATLAVGWILLVALVPMRVHKTLSIPIHSSVERPSEGTVPADLRAQFEHLLEAVAGEGFESVGWFRLEGLTSDTMSLMAVARHDGEQVFGSVLGSVRKSDEGLLVEGRFVEFSTDVEGREIATNNSSIPPTFHPHPDRQIVNFPEIDDPLELYRHHLDRLRRVDTARDLLPASEDLIAYLQSDIRDEYESQVEVGYLTLDAESHVYRPTWKGAMLMSWKHIWPLSRIL